MSSRLALAVGVPLTVLRTYRWRGLARRSAHEVRVRLNLFASQPRVVLASDATARVVSYRPAAPESLTRHLAIERASRVLEGWYQAYGGEWRRLPQAPGEWHRHPVVRFEFPLAQWWKVPLQTPGVDVKDVWEPGRFSWAYDLVRAYALTADRNYCIDFYRRLAAWEAANTPFRGPHWACGQEVAIRALAILHAEDSLPGSSDDARIALRVLCWSAERIADAVGYGLSQRNNHGISEAAGLVHLGLRLRGVHPHAARWLVVGTHLLNEQVCDQFSLDGWYAQHSFNYMRVALEQALYAQRALAAAGATLSTAALARLDAAVALLSSTLAQERSQITEPTTAPESCRSQRQSTGIFVRS
jgi:hypothetical protein